MHQAPGQRARGTQDERVAPGRDTLDQSKARVIDDRERADLRKIATHERQVMPLIDAANAPQFLDRPGRRLHAAERVAGVGRIRDQAAAAQDVAGAAYQPQMRMRWMDGKKLRHQVRRNSSISRATASGWSWCSMWPACAIVAWRKSANAARR